MFINKIKVLEFTKGISGKFSNKKQSQANSKDFPHINLFFRPIKYSLLGFNCIYSEQSYSFDPWAPYRQSIIYLVEKNDLIILKSYIINNSERFARGGEKPEILNKLNKDNISLREGCDMYFTQIGINHFKGKLVSQKKCFIQRGDKKTYLSSSAELLDDKWTCKDEGFDVNTGKKIWGGDNGNFIFEKIDDYGNDIDNIWIY